MNITLLYNVIYEEDPVLCFPYERMEYGDCSDATTINDIVRS